MVPLYCDRWEGRSDSFELQHYSAIPINGANDSAASTGGELSLKLLKRAVPAAVTEQSHLSQLAVAASAWSLVVPTGEATRVSCMNSRWVVVDGCAVLGRG